MSTKFKKAFVMKNLVMTAAAGALMLPSLGWSAADGRGHNGPDLAPTSIPVQLDRGIRGKQIEEAMKVCFAEGDSNTGVVSLLHRLVDELTKGHADIYANHYYFGSAGDESVVIPNAKEFDVTAHIIDENDRELVYLETKIRPDTFTFCTNPYANLSSVMCDKISLKTPAPLPTVKYQSIVQDTDYDEYGREDKREIILMGVSINFDPAVYGTAVRLLNTVTGAKSAITVNTVEYVECLKNEIQKRAE